MADMVSVSVNRTATASNIRLKKRIDLVLSMSEEERTLLAKMGASESYLKAHKEHQELLTEERERLDMEIMASKAVLAAVAVVKSKENTNCWDNDDAISLK